MSVTVRAALAVLLAGAYQTSTVLPFEFVDCEALVHVAPVCEILDTVLDDVFLVEITATKVFPFVGAVDKVTTQVLAEFVPVCPVALCTLAGNAGTETVLVPTSSKSREPEPDKVKFDPSTLFDILKSDAKAISVPL